MLMKRNVLVIFLMTLMVSCTNRKNSYDALPNDGQNVELSDSMRPDLPPPPPDSGRVDGHRPPPPPDGMRPDGPPPPPPHGKGRPPHKLDNMRGFDPASEDDMEDNGMSRYMENNDEEGWD